MAQNSTVRPDARISAAINESRLRGEEGVAVAVYYQGKLIIDSYDGLADPKNNKSVDSKTLFPVFSVTKGITALAAHIQAERGLLDVKATISQYWPEFAANGKGDTTVEDALSHRAGIPQMPQGVTPELMADWDWMVKGIASLKPIFPPGKVNAYHVLSWGWIIGELVRRTDPAKRSFDKFVLEEIFEPLGVSGDIFLGVPNSELSRVAVLNGGLGAPIDDQYSASPEAVFPASPVHNLRVVQQSVGPGAGIISTASAMARVFALLAQGGELDGVQLLSKDRVQSFTGLREGARDPDKIIPIPVWCGKAGYFLGGEPGASSPLVPNHADVLYSPGAGGSYAWADLQDGVSVAICHNNMDTGIIFEPEPTYGPIVRAIQDIVAELKAKEETA
ncbi:beta-lactamase/transpeptidase-like protein [Dactylonectria macrodidyma]|uniref:Beta-lactamase/transpeptidase-like protein n=1 Tax=Dactylonectria macrodidyma TaxID=307937 RepID=A0A9P9JJV4_9HYPO|nr:beta-lactamase/transpeptidase-like protein [Dactylonectria macrodidyma]